ncbi:hypothetical protein AAFF_G00380010 [Aldrovandia affinis]|uniref:Uncharacterized protein n=1 Tax=Aldrovandia affinis TaxID=143900 RepID=A0AAD7X1H4_9TELE|nr:hypothetical protein AAFF_G00380010 [Aldrovandia affinis]
MAGQKRELYDLIQSRSTWTRYVLLQTLIEAGEASNNEGFDHGPAGDRSTPTRLTPTGLWASTYLRKPSPSPPGLSDGFTHIGLFPFLRP